MGKHYNVRYIHSDSMTTQGSKSDVFRKYGAEWHISPLGKGNGNWLLSKKSDVTVDGKSCRSYVLNLYGRKKITEKLVDKFREELNAGKIKFPA